MNVRKCCRQLFLLFFFLFCHCEQTEPYFNRGTRLFFIQRCQIHTNSVLVTSYIEDKIVRLVTNCCCHKIFFGQNGTCQTAVSPDLSSIEDVWCFMKQKVQQQRPRTAERLKLSKDEKEFQSKNFNKQCLQFPNTY